MARRTQTTNYLLERLDDFSGGLNTSHPASIAKNDLAVAKNVLFTTEGKIVPRWGMAKRFAADFDSSPVLGMGALYKSDGTTRLVMAAGTTLYVDSPHVIFSYDSQSEWNSGTHVLDSAVSPGDLKLLAAPTSTFTRSTVAYNDDGTEVAANTPRYKLGKYNNGVWVEEPTQNLLTANQSSVETDTTGLADIWSSIISQDTTEHWHGNACLKVTAAGGTGRMGFSTQPSLVPASPGQTFTASVYVKGAGNSVGRQFRVDLVENGTGYPQSYTIFTMTSTWQRVTVTRTISGSDTTGIFFRVNDNTSGAVDGDVFYYDGGQIEQKPYATSWTLGGSTRAADNFSYTLPKPLPVRNAGCLWWKTSYGSGQFTRSLTVAEIQTSAGARRYNVRYEPTGTRFLIAKTTDGITWYYTFASGFSFSAGDIIFLAWLDDPVAGYMKLWVGINGGALSEYTTANTIQVTDAQKVYWGCYSSAGYECNGVIDDPQLYSAATIIASGGAVDTAFWNAIYQSATAQAWSMNTLFHSTLDSTLNVDADRQGVWVSPVQNASAAQNYASLAVYWTETLAAGTAIACQVRTSTNGTTWSTWYDQVNGEIASAPANPYSQVRFILQEVGNAGTPTLSKATVSYEGQPTVSNLLSGLSVAGAYSFAQLQDYMLIFNGVDIPKKYDGTTIADITSGPRAKYCCVYKNRVWAAKNNTLYFSDLLSIDSWPVANFIEVNPSDGDEIIALIPTTMLLLIVKQHSTYYLTGYSPQTFAVSPAGDVGTISPRGALWTPYGIFMLDREGVWQTDLRKRALLTRKINGIWETLNQRVLDKGALFIINERILVALPAAAVNGNDTVLIYDVLHQAWSKMEGWYPSCFLMFWERGKWKYLFGDSRKGQVYEIGGAANDAGTAFEALIETVHLPLLSESWEKRYKWCDVTFGKGETTQDVAVSFVTDGITGTEKTLNVSSGSGTVAGRFFTPAFGRTLGIRVRWPATDSSGPELLAAELTYFPRAARPVQVV